MKSWSATVLVAIAVVGFGTAAYVYGSRNVTTPALAAEAPAPMSSEAGTLPLTEDQKAAFGQLIREYLLENPEIIQEAFEALQRKEEEAKAAAASLAISTDKRIFNSSRQVVLGNPKGDVTLVEFFDYNCGYCRRAHADMKELLEADKNLRVVLKEFPVLGQGSSEAAHIGAAVNLIAPDRYFEFHDALLTERGQVDGAKALAIATDLGLDPAQIKDAANSTEVKATIQEVYELADKLAINGTPSYVTSKEVIVGAVGYNTLKIKIDQAREACADTPC